MTSGSAQSINPSPADSATEAAYPDLDFVLSSQAFEKAPTLRKLLQYLWEHRNEEINEYAIATEALNRKPDFEPRYDATVRVLVSRLRQRLKEFYEGDGASLATRILIPVGTHKVQVVEKEQQPAAELIPFHDRLQPIENGSWRINRRIIAVQFVIIILLLFVTGWLVRERSQKSAQMVQTDSTHLQVFWKQFLGNKNTRIIVPTPIFFRWKNGVVARDFQVNDFQALASSTHLKSLRTQFGKPELMQHYITVSDVFAALRIQRFLEDHSISIAISTTDDASIEVLDRENVIIAGNPHTLASLPDVVNRLSIQPDTNTCCLVNLHPLPGEPDRFVTVNESPTRIVTPGLIASLPGGHSGTHILVLMAGYQTSAIVAYLTSENGISEIERAQAAHGNAQYFEAVILSEIEGDKELGSKLALFRPLSAPR